MKNIIDILAALSGLKVIPLENNLELAYYENKDDFFIFKYSTYAELSELTDASLKDVQFILNSLVVDLKNSETFRALQYRSINQNLSLLLFLEFEDSISQSFKELNKAEENYINAKKYALPYRAADVEILAQKIEGSEDIVKTLNSLAVDNSNLLEKNEESWYDLLLQLFIKVPFLNYQPKDGQQSIGNLHSMIHELLDPRQAALLTIIKESNIADIADIETFVNSKNILS